MKNKLRVLHVVYAMDQGGIENWLMHLFREVKNDIQFDFLVNSKDKGYFDDEIVSLGGCVIYGGHFRNPLSHYLSAFTVLRSSIRYDSIHIHNVEGSINIFLAARKSKYKNIIIHAHNDLDQKIETVNLIQKFYLIISRIIINFLFKRRIAVSDSSGRTYFGVGNFKYIPIGENFQAYKENYFNSEITRVELGLKKEDLIISHVGRFFPQKNHMFLMRIIKEAVKLKGEKIKFLLIGDGPLRNSCEEFVNKNNLASNVLFLGIRGDVPNLLRISDGFIFPSLYEGLGLAHIEAQAAGVPVLMSDRIPEEGILVRNLVEKFSLDKSPREWAKKMFTHLSLKKDIDKEKALEVVLSSEFNLVNSIRLLKKEWQRK